MATGEDNAPSLAGSARGRIPDLTETCIVTFIPV